jgi:hypothetical protein
LNDLPPRIVTRSSTASGQPSGEHIKMPPVGLKSEPDLAIEIDNLKPLYCPGDTIIGRVIRTSAAVIPHIELNVRFIGSSQYERVERSGNNRRIYGTHFNFFGDTGDHVLALYDGPIDVAPMTWPFALRIPDRMSLDALLAGGNDQKRSFLPLDAEAADQMPLPASAYPVNSAYNFAYVQYYVEAEMKREGYWPRLATTPIFVGLSSTTSPIIDLSLSHRHLKSTINSYRLLTGDAQASLTLQQRARHMLHSSKVPSFNFQVSVTFPTVIQLGHSSNIPFRVRITSIPHAKSTVVRGVNVPVTVKWFVLKLLAVTETIFQGGQLLSVTEDLPFYFEKYHRDNTLQPSFIVSAPAGRLSEKNGTNPQNDGAGEIDLGEIYELRVDAKGVSPRNQFASNQEGLENRIYPSFTTFNIKHTHNLKWKIKLDVAGESVTMNGTESIQVLEPSNERVGMMMDLVDKEATRRMYLAMIGAARLTTEGLDALGTLLEIVSEL